VGTLSFPCKNWRGSDLETATVLNLGFQEIVVIPLVALIFLGPNMLPEIASGLGKVIREVRKAAADIKSEIGLDEAIRKPLAELREATMLPPEELKRRDAVPSRQAAR
jgi:Tat protein translocase TatB subunit